MIILSTKSQLNPLNSIEELWTQYSSDERTDERGINLNLKNKQTQETKIYINKRASFLLPKK